MISPREQAITFTEMPLHCIQKKCHAKIDFFIGIETHLDGEASLSFLCLDCISSLWAKIMTETPLDWKTIFQDDTTPVSRSDYDRLIDERKNDNVAPARLSRNCQWENCSSPPRTATILFYDTKFLVPLMVVCDACLIDFEKCMNIAEVKPITDA